MNATPTSSTDEVLVLGAGFAGLATASYLAKSGHRVRVVERHDTLGGRARKFEVDGFTFDMGPSWYWMPDVFERYFKDFGADVNEEMNLVRLDPSYTVWFEDGPLEIPAGLDALAAVFEKIEVGAGRKLREFMAEAEVKYNIGMNKFVNKPAHNALEFAEWQTVVDATRLSLFTSFSAFARKHFTHPKLLQIMEFPVLFLGAKPEDTPALYSLMNYADTCLGTWYPMGGMNEIVQAMVRVAERQGVVFQTSSEVAAILDDGGRASGVVLDNGRRIEASAVVATGDYHHVEQSLVPAKWRRYDEAYWDNRTMSPSSLLYYVGLDTRVPELQHHNLFFDTPFGPHAETIYDSNSWPDDPLFYVSAPSRTDSSVAPEGCENLFFLIPLAPGLEEDGTERDRYFEEILTRLETHLGRDLRPHITYKRSFAHREFQQEYSSYKGNAYGLANTLRQTAFWKPKMRSKLPGLHFAGQLTTPGPGVPPSLISGEVAARETARYLHTRGILPQEAHAVDLAVEHEPSFQG